MRLDWLRERASQQFFCLVFLPGLGLINPADFFTKILPAYRQIAALPFLYGTPFPIFHHPHPSHPILTIAPVVAMQSSTGTPLPKPPHNFTAFCFYLHCLLCLHASRLTRLCYSLVLSPTLSRETNAPANPGTTAGCWSLNFLCLFHSFLPSRRSPAFKFLKKHSWCLASSRKFATSLVLVYISIVLTLHAC
jgi:hypothetical protein